MKVLKLALSIAATTVVLAGCGGGGGSSDSSTAAPVPTPPGIPDSQRVAAATTTAQNNGECTTIRPFYWEIGDKSAPLASGSVPSGSQTYSRTTTLSIASASKWIYGAYVVQRRNSALTAEDIKYLHFQSGYTSFTSCDKDQSIAECAVSGTNGVYTAANDGKFVYGGGHMEKHASLLGLGSLHNADLAAEMKSQLGSDVSIAYSSPQLAGGIFTSAEVYSVFLRKVLSGGLLMRSALGTNPVCTNPATCPTAVQTPSPRGESWHYAVGHWVEDDPAVGDGAFSSPGAFGFYPWIDASKTYYGVVSRLDPTGALDSVYCGRLIRKAWVTGVAQ